MNIDKLKQKIIQEGNFEIFIDKKTQYRCKILRPREWGHWCGYVRLPQDHRMNDYNLTSYDPDHKYQLFVHGGITYHRTEQDGYQWVGFDCCHSGDLDPRNVIIYSTYYRDFKNEIYRTKEYVKEQTIDLAYQLWLIP